MSKVKAPFGKWPSPITVDLLTGSAIAISDTKSYAGNLYFLESRPFEGGRSALVKMNAQGEFSDIVDPKTNVRTKVHEYGGAGYHVGNHGLIYSNFIDSRLYHASLETPLDVKPVTPPNKPWRFACYEFHPEKPVMVAVCEDHTDPAPADVKTYLVEIDLTTSSVTKLIEGADFYSDPKFSPDGGTLVYKSWMHPDMPWTKARFTVVSYPSLEKVGHLGKEGYAVTQPRFMRDGTLLFASDESGYQQLYRSSPPYESYSPVCDFVKGDFAGNDWMFGNASYVCSDGIIATYTSPKGTTLLASIDDTLKPIEHPFLTIDSLAVHGDGLIVTGSTRQAKGLFSFTNRVVKTLKSAIKSDVPEEFMSLAQPLEIPIGKRHTYGFYYPPTSGTHAGDGKPPLLMRVHGGPTSFAPPATTLQISYWTSRGYAFFNLNYSGSSGFGREYMSSLDSNWGVLDLEDAVGAANWLAENGYCDATKMAIDGGSAGGYTVLNTLCHSTTFAAGCSLYGVSELSALASDTHKFESQYLYNLVGGTPAEIPQVYRDRSPLYQAAMVKNPIMLQQGTEDRVVPINQAEDMVKVIKEAGGAVELLVFEGEGHGFRGAKAQRESLESETRFFEEHLKL